SSWPITDLAGLLDPRRQRRSNSKGSKPRNRPYLSFIHSRPCPPTPPMPLGREELPTDHSSLPRRCRGPHGPVNTPFKRLSEFRARLSYALSRRAGAIRPELPTLLARPSTGLRPHQEGKFEPDALPPRKRWHEERQNKLWWIHPIPRRP